MKTLYLFLISILIIQCKPLEEMPEQITAPKSDDEIAIENVIQNYFDGWLTGDTSLVGSAMHSSCNLKFIRNEKVEQRSRQDYLSGFKPSLRVEGGEGRIIHIDITRTAATAKVELETPNRLFTDYFNLLKAGERWFITDKVSTSSNK